MLIPNLTWIHAYTEITLPWEGLKYNFVFVFLLSNPNNGSIFVEEGPWMGFSSFPPLLKNLRYSIGTFVRKKWLFFYPLSSSLKLSPLFGEHPARSFKSLYLWCFLG